ncbi:DMT family transporter [Aquitalea sp. ASV15]|uniref:DMT family transporter n=1 Tax=Aquitalea sp. ASV15 TaxID=2795104 RepID=UPI0018EBF7F6|nr:DMT family transporter [Aquitalea sp. ASV15]
MRTVATSGVLSAIMAALCWGSATVMSKFVIGTVNAILLLGLQLAASVLVLWAIVLCKNLRPTTLKNRWQFASLGLLEPWLAYLLGLIGLSKTEAIGATLIQSSEAILILAIGAIIARKLPNKKITILSFVGFLGLILSLGVFELKESGDNNYWSMFLISLGTAIAAIYVILSSKIAGKAHPIYIVALQQTVALLLTGALLLLNWHINTEEINLPSDASTWLIIIASGLIQFAIGFSLYIYALQTLTANLAGSFLNLTPIFGIACAVLFLGERMSHIQIAGAVLVIAAVTLINKGGGSGHVKS